MKATVVSFLRNTAVGLACWTVMCAKNGLRTTASVDSLSGWPEKQSQSMFQSQIHTKRQFLKQLKWDVNKIREPADCSAFSPRSEYQSKSQVSVLLWTMVIPPFRNNHEWYKQIYCEKCLKVYFICNHAIIHSKGFLFLGWLLNTGFLPGIATGWWLEIFCCLILLKKSPLCS